MTATDRPAADLGHRLLWLGAFLFLLGLLTGFGMPAFANPRMGLASHIQGVVNGLFLIALGLLWPRLALGPRARSATFGLALYGTFANWLATLLAAIWGGGRSMPIAGGGETGSAVQEAVLDGLLFSLSFAMIAVSVLVLVGLRRPSPAAAGDPVASTRPANS